MLCIQKWKNSNSCFVFKNERTVTLALYLKNEQTITLALFSFLNRGLWQFSTGSETRHCDWLCHRTDKYHRLYPRHRPQTKVPVNLWRLNKLLKNFFKAAWLHKVQGLAQEWQNKILVSYLGLLGSFFSSGASPCDWGLLYGYIYNKLEIQE